MRLHILLICMHICYVRAYTYVHVYGVPSFKCAAGSYSIDVFGNTGVLLQDSQCVCDKLAYAGCAPNDIQPVYEDIYDKYVRYEPSIPVFHTYPVDLHGVSPHEFISENGTFGLPVTYVIVNNQKIKHTEWEIQCVPPNLYVHMYAYPINATTCAYKKNIIEHLASNGADGRVVSCPEGCRINERNGCTPLRNGTLCGNVSMKEPVYDGVVHICPDAYHLIHLQSDTALGTHMCAPDWYYEM